jgi:hypothetical protein
MRGPADDVDSGRVRRLTVGCTVAAIAVFAMLAMLDQQLKPALPGGIVSLQLAMTAQHSANLVAAMSPDQRLWCAFGLGADSLFMFLYPAAVVFGVTWAGRALQARRRALAAVAPLVAWAMVAGGLAEVVENALLMAALLGHHGGAPIASTAAVVKFLTLGAGLGYCAVAALVSRRPVAGDDA